MKTLKSFSSFSLQGIQYYFHKNTFLYLVVRTLSGKSPPQNFAINGDFELGPSLTCTVLSKLVAVLFNAMYMRKFHFIIWIKFTDQSYHYNYANLLRFHEMHVGLPWFDQIELSSMYKLRFQDRKWNKVVLEILCTRQRLSKLPRFSICKQRLSL